MTALAGAKCLWALHTNLWTYTLSRQDGIMEDAAWIDDQRRGWLSDWLVRHLRPAKWHRRYCIWRRQNRLDSASCVHWSLRSHRAFRPRWKGFYFRWAFQYILCTMTPCFAVVFYEKKNTLRKKLTLTLKRKIHCNCPRVIACVDCVISCQGFSNFHLTSSYKESFHRACDSLREGNSQNIFLFPSLRANAGKGFRCLMFYLGQTFILSEGYSIIAEHFLKTGS